MIEDDDNLFWNFDKQEILREEELARQQRWQQMSEQERMNVMLFSAAEEGNLEEIKCLVSKGVKVSITDYLDCGIITKAALKGHLNVVRYALENSKNSDYSDDCLEKTFERAIIGGNLEIVKMLLDHSIKSENGIREAMYHFNEEIAQYLIEHNNGSFGLYANYGRQSILEIAALSKMPSLVDLIIIKYPEMVTNCSELEQVVLTQRHLSIDVIRVLRQHLFYFDVNNVPTSDFHYEYYKTKSVLHALVFSYKSQDFCRLYREVKFFVAYGALLAECGRIREELLEEAPIKIEHRMNGCTMKYGEFVELYNSRQAHVEVFDRAEKEGLEIWRWNQGVMKEVVKWSGCVMRGDLMGLGKHAVEVVVKFAPAQFEEKLELSTVRMLRAQMMLEMGHGVTFGDVHHGGYVKYAGTIGEGVTLHRWNATVTCDYHIDVKMKGVARIVQVSGDSYVDKAIEAKGVVSYVHVWGGDAYDQKLYAQQQWYVETGETLPTLAETQVGAQMEGIVTHSTSQRQHDVMHHMHDHAFRHISQVVVLPHPQQQHNHIEHSLELHDNSLHTSSQLIPHTTDFFSL